MLLILGVVFRVKLSDEDIADFELLRDVAMATIFGFLYMGCTLAPPEDTTEPPTCGSDAALCQITLTTCWQLEKNLLNSNTSSIYPHNMVNFSWLTAEIGSVVWGTPANFNGFRILAALLHGTLEVGISQTLRHWVEGATYVQQAGYHVGHWPTF